jgi:hypothetical protein
MLQYMMAVRQWLFEIHNHPTGEEKGLESRLLKSRDRVKEAAGERTSKLGSCRIDSG